MKKRKSRAEKEKGVTLSKAFYFSKPLASSVNQIQ